MSDLLDKLVRIQKDLIAPKNQFNKFGGYNYRSCEDILEGLKPLLDGVIVTVSDTIEMIGNRVYVKATAKITDGKESIECSAYARESEVKKGMDDAQITGSASSYARKYALNGLFLIDDNKDPDSKDGDGKVLDTKEHLKYQGIADAIVAAIAKDDLYSAAEEWWPLSKEDKECMWKAESKGGYFNQATKKILQSKEFREVYHEKR